ncbi:MAG TPA: SAM-dependent methyltransferase, partial [Anaeromyxobacteraceae bacterium]|nr:SAM-dependent methyltransferase [Anaeromyxobacteraceae bacterium]
ATPAGGAGAPPDYAAIVAAADRTAEDRALDGGRRPAELLAFLQARPGMRVAEIGAAGGYMAELLARAVAPGGTVYAQNSHTMTTLAGPGWPSRLARPAMKGVVRVDRELEDPLPSEARGIDLVVLHAVYHDTVWLGTDRTRMNRALFEALAPGGALVVVDSSARAGSGTSDSYDLHRIDEAVVRQELQSAGFRLAATSDFLRNPSDTRDWSAAPLDAGERRGTSDRFALRFVKP